MKTIIIAVTVFLVLTAFNLYKKKKSFDSTDFLAVGKLLYAEDSKEFETFYNDFLSDKEAFMDENADLIDEYGFEKMTGFDVIYVFGDSKGLLGYMDWKGEENDREVETSIEGKLNGIKVEWTLAEKLREKNKNADQRDGSFILKLFKAADDDLRKVGYALLFPDIDADGYSFTPVSLETFEKIKALAPQSFKGAIDLKE